MATIYADRTRLDGDYHLGIATGTFALVGDFAADSAALDPSMLAGVTQPLAAAAKTPIGPVADEHRQCDRPHRAQLQRRPARSASSTSPAAARRGSPTPTSSGPDGARARVFGGSGVTYYWPSGGLRIDGNIEMAGGGLAERPGEPSPAARRRADERRRRPRALHRQRAAARADADPLRPGTRRIDRAQHRRAARRAVPRRPRAGAAAADHRPDRPRRQLRLRHLCAVVSFNYLQMSSLQLGATRLPVCPIGPAIIVKRPGGAVLASARVQRPGAERPPRQLAAHLAAAGGQIVGKQFGFNSLAHAARQADVAGRLRRRAADRQLRRRRHSAAISAAPRRRSAMSRCCSATASGTLAVPQQQSQRRQRADGLRPRRRTRASIRCKSDNVHFTLAGDYVRATGALRHPASGTLVTNVNIEHRLSTGAGHATLDVPGLTFGPELPARRAHPPDRRRDRAGQRHDQRPRPDRLDRERQGHLDRRFLDRQPRPRCAVRAGHRASAATIHFNDLLGPDDAAGPGADRQVDQPRHPRRERRDPLPAAAQPAGQDRARRMAVHGRPPDPRGDGAQFRPAERQAADVRGRQGLDAQARSSTASASRSSTRPARSTACCR